MHGLTPQDLAITDAAIRRIIADYTREAGLRNLEREIAAICRKVARRRAEGQRGPTTIEPKRVADLLGPSRFFRELADRTGVAGVATGLAWTPTGGEILFIEATGMPGKGQLTLTGLLGESMRESAQAALSYLGAIPRNWSWTPRGSTRPTCTSTCRPAPSPRTGRRRAWRSPRRLISLFRGKAIQPDLAMTGEVTLTGRVLPVGGVREKILAARRAGIKSVLIPRHNEKDLVEIPAEVKADLSLQLVDTLDDVVPRLFQSLPPPRAEPPRRAAKKTPPRVRPTGDPASMSAPMISPRSSHPIAASVVINYWSLVISRRSRGIAIAARSFLEGSPTFFTNDQ